MKFSSLIILFLCCLFAYTSAEAQYRNNYKRHGSKLDIRGGVQAGVSFPKFVGDDFIIAYDAQTIEVYPEVSYESLIGYTAGIYADIRLTEGFIIQPEINFTQMGTKMIRQVDIFNEEGGYVVSDSSFVNLGVTNINIHKRLNYLSIPLLVKFPIDKGFVFSLGPQFSFKLSEEDTYAGVALPDELLETLPFIDAEAPSLFKDSDIGAIVALGYQMKNGFNFNVRFNKNFKNLNVNEGLRILTREPDNKSQAFIMTLGYTFLYDKRLREDPTGRH